MQHFTYMTRGLCAVICYYDAHRFRSASVKVFLTVAIYMIVTSLKFPFTVFRRIGRILLIFSPDDGFLLFRHYLN